MEDHLRRLSSRLPKPVSTRIASSLDHFERAHRLLEIDREMASFRAITGEEEAATALMRAIQLKGYEGASRLNPWRHHHKAAIVACVMAIAPTLRPFLQEFQLTFKFDEGRIDVRVPLSNFGIEGGDDIALQPVEPLGMLHSRPGVSDNEVFDALLAQLAHRLNAASIRHLVAEQANKRNRLLYASDTALPRSIATAQTIDHLRQRAQALLVLTVMVSQAAERQALVRQGLTAVLRVI
jgi:hypothetical protein